MAIKQSLCYPIFLSAGQTLDDLCREAAAAGYAAIEMWGWDATLGEIVATARRHGLVVASMTGHESIDHSLNDAAQHDRIEGELRASIDQAAEYGIPGIIVFGGGRNPRTTDLESLTTWIKGIRRVVPYAEERGVNLNLEILNSKIDHPGYVADRVDWAIAACEAVASPRVKLLFDIYHVQIMEGDIIRNLQKCLPYLGHVHTAGNPGRHDLDETQELNYPAICRALSEGGYEGFVGHEFWARGDRFDAMRAAFRTCNV